MEDGLQADQEFLPDGPQRADACCGFHQVKTSALPDQPSAHQCSLYPWNEGQTLADDV